MKPELLDALWSAMGCLYTARSAAEGPPFDEDTFNEIADLQTQLQRLLSGLEKKGTAEESEK